jgi:hypothetical protein
MSVPVERCDPFRVVDVSALAPEEAGLLERYRLQAVVSLGLATMGSDPEAYSVEILPRALRARRAFLGGTIYAIAAAVLAACFLVYQGWRTSSELGRVRAEVTRLEAELRRAQSTDRKVRELSERNQRLARDAALLLGVAGSGEQLARALEHCSEHLPEGFWIGALSSDWRHDEGLGVERGAERPLLRLECRAREGTESIASLLDRFVGSVREAFPLARFQYAPSASGEEFTLDFTLFAPPSGEAPVSPGAEAPGEPGESAKG